MTLLELTLDNLPRLIAAVFAVYGLMLLLFRWRITRVLTQERRFLFLALTVHLINVCVNAVSKTMAHAPADASSWLSVLVVALFTGYIFYSLPTEFRRVKHRFSRKRRSIRKGHANA